MTAASDLSPHAQCSPEVVKPLGDLLTLLLRMFPALALMLALRPRKAAKALDISPRLLWQLTKDGHIPCVRVGTGKRKTVLYPVADLQAWLTRQAAVAKGGEQ